MSQADNADDTPLIGTDHDLAKITLHKIDPAASDGTVSLTVSDPSSVRLFKDDGTELTETALDLANPTGDLAGPLNGDVNVWVEGLKANPDLSIKIAYSDSSGDETSSDTIHMTVADWTFVDKAGDTATQAGSFDMNNLLTDAQGNPQDPLPADDSEYKVKIDGLAASDVESLEATSVADPSDGYSDTLVSNGSSIESANWAVLYHSEQNSDGSDKLLNSDQRQEISGDLQLNAVHNDYAYYRLGTAQDDFTRTLPAWRGIYNEKILRTALESDPNYGAVMKFVFDQLDQAKDGSGKPRFTFSVEPLLARNFDGTADGIYVDNSATTLAQAKQWAMNAFREWAADNTSLLSNGSAYDPAKDFFGLLARTWARHYFYDVTIPTAPTPLTTPDPDAPVASLASTLDFLYLFSSGAAGADANDEMYDPVANPRLGFQDASHIFQSDLPNIYLWVFADRRSFMPYINKTVAKVNIPSLIGVSGGLNHDYWEWDTTGSNKPTPTNPRLPDGSFPLDDQTHHFAGFFYLGAEFGGDDGLLPDHDHRYGFDAGLVGSLKNTGDYPGPVGPSPSATPKNKGDYYLGVIASDIGAAYRLTPVAMGVRIAKELKEPYSVAKALDGRRSDP